MTRNQAIANIGKRVYYIPKDKQMPTSITREVRPPSGVLNKVITTTDGSGSRTVVVIGSISMILKRVIGVVEDTTIAQIRSAMKARYNALASRHQADATDYARLADDTSIIDDPPPVEGDEEL